MIVEKNVDYEKYSGRIYVSKQSTDEKQGFNVAELLPDGSLRILGYTQRDEANGRTVEKAVRGILKSYGWFDHVIEEMLSDNPA